MQLPIPGMVHLAYPRGADGVVHQCAWCQRVSDRAGRFRIPASELLRDASHGCCSRCASLLRPGRF